MFFWKTFIEYWMPPFIHSSTNDRFLSSSFRQKTVGAPMSDKNDQLLKKASLGPPWVTKVITFSRRSVGAPSEPMFNWLISFFSICLFVFLSKFFCLFGILSRWPKWQGDEFGDWAQKFRIVSLLQNPCGCWVDFHVNTSPGKSSVVFTAV